MSSSSSHMANRQSGVCQGSLWRQCEALGAAIHKNGHGSNNNNSSSSGATSSSSYMMSSNSTSSGGGGSSSSNSSPTKTTSSRVHEYCVLVGIQLATYESRIAWERGDYPVANFTIVGATSTATGNDPFRLVTNQGTQVTCTAPTRSCRDVWLSAFQAGLEGRLNSMIADDVQSTSSYAAATVAAEDDDEYAIIPPVKPKHYSMQKARFCQSCGKVERLEYPLCGKVSPLPSYGLEDRCDLCKHCLISQGMLDQAKFVQSLHATASHERKALLKARQILWNKLAKRNSRVSLEDDDDDDDDDNDVNIRTSNTNSTNSTNGRSSTTTHKNSNSNKDDKLQDKYSLHYFQQVHEWIPSDGSTWLFQQVLQSKEFMACQRLSPILEGLSHQYLSGIVGLLEFMEQLDQAVGCREEHDSLNELKKQAFRVAGDMGTAMKLLLEHALPNVVLSSPSSISGANNNNNNSNNNSNRSSSSAASSAPAVADTGMLRCILEFFLDLAADGELQSLAFFFPQLCSIHLRMLPPTNHADLLRVELIEDFLLTICCKYSVQLAIELIWSHLADLEDAWTVVERLFAAGTLSSTFTSSSTSSATAYSSPSIQQACRRRFAVLRFLCELESLLFDFEGGWGGGSVTLGHLIQPSKNQVRLLKQTMKRLQRNRRAVHPLHGLSQSTRMDKITNRKSTFPMEVLAQEALRITKNADYLSSHLVFTKRLCDIAEKLRFLNVSDRAGALQAELHKLNASGSMGGDPLNNIQLHLSRVVRVPSTEGHVFRSKERTPVLLLMEVLDEGALVEEDEKAQEAHNALHREPETEAQDPSKAEEEEKKIEENGSVGGHANDKQIDELDQTTENGHVSISAVQTDAPDDDNDKDGERVLQVQNGSTSLKTTQVEVPLDADEQKPSGEGVSNLSPRTMIKSVNSDDEEFHSAAGSIAEDIVADELELPHLGEEKAALEIDTSSKLEGSMGEDEEMESKHALRRFDSPKGSAKPVVVAKTPSKEDVELLVTSVVNKHLSLPNLEANSNKSLSLARDDASTLVEDQERGARPQNLVRTKSASDKARPPTARRISTLGSSTFSEDAVSDPSSETRRKVLDTIMRKGASHTVAAGVSTAAQRSLQELERRRAVALLLKADDDATVQSSSSDADGGSSDIVEATRQDLLSLGISPINSGASNLEGLTNDDQPTEDDEAMEAIRLLLIQYRVAQGHITINAAAQALAPGPRSTVIASLKTSGTGKEWPTMKDPKETPKIEAGDVDSRLLGCGILPPAVLQALTLWKGGMVSNGELLELVKKDLEYVRHSLALEDSRDKLSEDSAFWGRFAFGERWAEKRSRIAATSPQACKPGWDLLGVIIKSNDDLRQEAFVMQLIELCREAFQDAGLELWLHPYRIISAGRTTGIIEMVRNAMSFDALKKRPGYGTRGLRGHLRRMTEFSANPQDAFKVAQSNFVRSLAAYSLLSYMFMFKDRHNGNILLDTAGHVIHIDFGFVFGIAPGGSFSLEMSTPFKLTEEMIDVMDGVKSSLFSEFVTLFCCGFLALQAHCDTFLTIVEITCQNSTFSCFEGKSGDEIVQQLRGQFRPDLDKEETIAFALDLIKDSVESYGTSQYDYFQYLSQGIAA